MKVKTKEQAFAEANKIFPTDYEKDSDASKRAGYDIYRHATLNYTNHICDLGNRLEVITGENGENITNIWIDEEPETMKLKDFLKMVKEPVQVVVKEEGHCFKCAFLSTGFEVENYQDCMVYEVSSVVTWNANAKLSVTVW